MTADLYPSHDPDAVVNPRLQLPIALCLDVSRSMAGEPMEALNDGLEHFYRQLRSDPLALATAQVALVPFAGRAGNFRDFENLGETGPVPKMGVLMGGKLPPGTDLAGAVQLGLKKLRQRVENNGGVGHAPFLLLLSDGRPSTPIESAAQAAREAEVEKRVKVFPIGVGPHARLDVLDRFSARPAVRLRGFDFLSLFDWLSRSVSAVSRSVPDTQVRVANTPLPPFAETAVVGPTQKRKTARATERPPGTGELWDVL